jgi:hypothetical protein
MQCPVDKVRVNIIEHRIILKNRVLKTESLSKIPHCCNTVGKGRESNIIKFERFVVKLIN